jgi:hypothetical protein
MAEIASEPVRQAFAKAVSVERDRLRRSVDRIEASRRLAACQEDCNATAMLTIDVAGETFAEPLQFRVWTDGSSPAPTTFSSGADLERGERIEWSDPASFKTENFVFDVPAAVAALEIEFTNDDWDQARGLDRNLGILRVRIDGEDIRLSCFRITEGYADNVIQTDALLLFIRNGTVRLERPC